MVRIGPGVPGGAPILRRYADHMTARWNADRAWVLLVSPWIVAVVLLMGVLVGYSVWILLNDPHVWLGTVMTLVTGSALVHAAGQQVAVLGPKWLWVPFHRRIWWHEVREAVIEPVPTTLGEAYSVVLYTSRHSRQSGEPLACSLPGLASSIDDAPRLIRYVRLAQSRLAPVE